MPARMKRVRKMGRSLGRGRLRNTGCIVAWRVAKGEMRWKTADEFANSARAAL
jgi:hypothetical protein